MTGYEDTQDWEKTRTQYYEPRCREQRNKYLIYQIL